MNCILSVLSPVSGLITEGLIIQQLKCMYAPASYPGSLVDSLVSTACTCVNLVPEHTKLTSDEVNHNWLDLQAAVAANRVTNGSLPVASR